MEGLGLTALFGRSYEGRRVLVTGHTGFKGSWLVLWLRSLGAEVGGLALPPDTDPAHWDLLRLPLDFEARVDLRDSEAVRRAVGTFRPEVVFHLGAQALVRRGYRAPTETFATNVLGLVHVLEAVRACDSVRAVVNATTDKVYEPHASERRYCESDPLGGHDPYSASKACAELVSACYRRSYFAKEDHPESQVRLATARAGNVVGGGDWAEDRLVPDLIRSALRGESLRLRNPRATRPWQHVLEPLSGYLRIGQLLLAGRLDGDTWNLGPTEHETLAVGDVVALLHRHWPALKVEHDVHEHPPEAPWLALDSGKAMHELGWHSVWGAGVALQRTSDWYRAFFDDRAVRSGADLASYVDAAREQGLQWTA